MSFEDTTNRGASIIPSARKSIHSHQNCLISTGSMGRYGVSPSSSTSKAVGSLSLSSQSGTDEVDNVLSKPLTLSPSLHRNINKRRNSHSPNNSQELLSEDEEYFNGSFENRTHETTDQDISRSFNSSRSFKSDESLPRDRSVRKEKHAKGKGSAMNFVIGTALSLLVAFYNLKNFGNSESVYYNEQQYSHDLQDLGEKYRIMFDNMKVQSGVATIFNKEDTGSFIFLYDSKNSNFIQSDFDNFINEIAAKTSKYLRNESQGVEHLTIDSNTLTSLRTHIELMNNYKEEVDRTGVMLVKEMDNVPSGLAMAFHYYCDEYNPLVKRSAIFFTLDVGRCSNNNGYKKVQDLVEKCLASKWTGVPLANIGPLLTRVVDVVVVVTT